MSEESHIESMMDDIDYNYPDLASFLGSLSKCDWCDDIDQCRQVYEHTDESVCRYCEANNEYHGANTESHHWAMETSYLNKRRIATGGGFFIVPVDSNMLTE